MPCQGEVLKVVGVTMKDLQEGRRGENITTGSQHSEHFGNCSIWSLEVLENRFAVEQADALRGERKTVRIPDDIHVRERGEIQVEETRVGAKWTASNRYRGTDTLPDRHAEGLAGAVTPGRLDMAEAAGERSRAPILT